MSAVRTLNVRTLNVSTHPLTCRGEKGKRGKGEGGESEIRNPKSEIRNWGRVSGLLFSCSPFLLFSTFERVTLNVLTKPCWVAAVETRGLLVCAGKGEDLGFAEEPAVEGDAGRRSI
jgi:hypothetical protein